MLMLFACASPGLSGDDSADTATGAPKMIERPCERVDQEFVVEVGSTLPPPATIYLGVAQDGVLVWRPADSVGYRAGAFHALATIYTDCLAYVQ
jgi:hypothetical protein